MKLFNGFRVEWLTDANLYRKFAISFLLMSLVPIVFLIFLIFYFRLTPVIETHIPYFRLTILLVVLLSLASFDLIRRSMIALRKFNTRAREIAQGGYNKRVAIEAKDELGHIASSFNRITTELETKIRELEESKALVQSILGKIGTAITSTKGIENLLELIVQSIIRGIQANSGAIFLIDEPLGDLVIRISYGVEKRLEGLRIRPHQGLISTVMESKKPALVSNVSENAAAYSEYNIGLAKNSIIFSPLLFKDKVWGVIMAADKKNNEPFTEDDLVLVNNVAAQTAIAIENFQLNEDAEKTYLQTISALAVAVEAKDPYSRGHLYRVVGYVEKLGKQMNLDEKTMRILRNGAILHDVGKIGIRDEVLKKEGPLTPDEEQYMREHVIIGVNIIKPIRSMADLCDLVRYHQELYDGSGYPDGLKGEQIPLTARILKVCDAYDAMTTTRPYRKAMDKEDVKKELLRKSGTEFDPNIVKEFLKII